MPGSYYLGTREFIQLIKHVFRTLTDSPPYARNRGDKELRHRFQVGARCVRKPAQQGTDGARQGRQKCREPTSNSNKCSVRGKWTEAREGRNGVHTA